MKRYIDANLPEEGLRSRVTVLRDDPPPGEEAQIDYGYLGSWTDPVRGEFTRRIVELEAAGGGRRRAGNFLWSGALTSPKTVGRGDTISLLTCGVTLATLAA